MQDSYSVNPAYYGNGGFVVGGQVSGQKRMKRWQFWGFVLSGVAILGMLILLVVTIISSHDAYTIYFSSNGGSTVEAQTVNAGKVGIEPEEPTRTGYVFAGWYIGDEKYDFSQPLESDIYLTARWNRAESASYYSVLFNAGDGSGFFRQMVALGDKVIEPTVPTREGYVFDGWYNGDEEWDFNDIITEDIVLVAKWKESTDKKYVVTFNSNGGNKIARQTVKKGEKATKPQDPVRDGYVFVGWYDNDEEFNFDTAITKDIKLVARWAWSDNTPEYSDAAWRHISNATNGSASSGSNSSNSNSSSSNPSNPVPTPTPDPTPTPTPEPEPIYYTVIFDSNGGTSVISQSILAGTTAVQPTNPVRDGYTFLGWYSNGSQYDFGTVVTSNLVLKAEWQQKATIEDPNEPTREVVITFVSDNATYLKTTVLAGNTVTQPNNPTKSGHTFKGWKLNGSYYDFTTVVLQDITLVAEWEKNSSESGSSGGGGGSSATTKYTVTFNSDGGSSVGSQTVESGKTATRPTDPTKTNYIFDGWYYGSTLYNFSTPITSNITLKAKWTYNAPVQNTYTVSFNTHGGSSVSSQSVTEGSRATVPKSPTRSGYTFIGWYTNDGAFNFNDTTINQDTTIYALWAPMVDYRNSASGKWIFINNPEFILDKSMFADSDAPNGHHLIYKDDIDQKTEIYWEHGIRENEIPNAGTVYYGFKFFNPSTSTATLKINACGAGYYSNWLNTWQQYYTGTCNIKDQIFSIPAKGHVMIFLNNNQTEGFKTAVFSSGNNSYNQDQIIPLVGDSVKKYNAFDGVLNVTPSTKLNMAVMVFNDYSKVGGATYEGNFMTYKRTDGQTGLRLNTGSNIGSTIGSLARLSSGYYNALPEKTMNMTYEIEDQTPVGTNTMLNVSFVNAMGNTKTKNFWYTHQQGGGVQWANGRIRKDNNGKVIVQPDDYDFSEYYVGDFVNLNLKNTLDGNGNEVVLYPYSLGHTDGDPRESYGYYGGSSSADIENTKGWPYSWGNWAVHYNENINIVNNSSTKKTVKYTILQRTDSTSLTGHDRVVYGNSGQNIIIKGNNAISCNNNNTSRTVTALPYDMGTSTYHMEYNKGKSSEYCVDYYPTTYNNSGLTYHIVTVEIEPRSSKLISLTSNLGGMSSGLITKWLTLAN